MTDDIRDDPLDRAARDDIGTARTAISEVPTSDSVFGSSPSSTVPDKLLLCLECEVVYGFDEDWTVCPRCGEDLTEVEKA